MGEAHDDPPSIMVQNAGAWFNVGASRRGVFVRTSGRVDSDGIVLPPELAELLGRALIAQARSSRRLARRGNE